PGTNGWYTTPVGITWTPSAAGPSGQNLSSDCSEVTTGETAGHTFTCTVTTGAGIASAPGAVTVKVDETKPVVTYTGNAGSYSVLQTVNILCAATDNLSGVASSTCQQITGPAYGYALGQHTFSATATDNAGNTGSGATAVNVVVASGDICTLTEAWVTQPGKGGGIANSLCVKLRHAQYGAYINEVSAQSGKAIATDKAAILIGLAKLM
ncbi:MAG TPA: hypothetical protein VHB25_13810, partial [Gemmatimonadaceae bacterium]|nr:hypothetical protein [Gemmatimonadaceae bacterium]